MKTKVLLVTCCLSTVTCAMELPREPVTPVLRDAFPSLGLVPAADAGMRDDSDTDGRQECCCDAREYAEAPSVRRRRTAESLSAPGSRDGNTLFLCLKQFTDCCITARLGDDLTRRGGREFFSRALQENNLAVLSALIVTSDLYAPFLDRAQVELLYNRLRSGRFFGQDCLLRAVEQWLLRARCADSGPAKGAGPFPQWVDLGL